MTEPRKRTAAEVWRALEKVTADADLERIDALSDDDLDRELRAAGVDPAEAGKIGSQVLAKTQKEGPRPPRKLRWVAWVGAGAAAALIAIALVREQPIVGAGRPAPTPKQQAAQLRGDAFSACAQGLWSACEDQLNAARALDPGGEMDPKVLAARQSLRDVIRADASR
jgi:hypothetical protein